MSIDPRVEAIRSWVATRNPGRAFRLEPASADASFRRYFRVTFDDMSTLVAMDAPPEREDCRPFLHAQAVLASAGVHVPAVHATDLERGFLLLSDLGTTTYLGALDAQSAPALYDDAITALVAFQGASRAGVFPDYDRALLERELALFPDWYVTRQKAATLSERSQRLLNEAFDRILENNLAQPRVFVHRDYHSRNLMVSTPNPGVLDFQDAVYGPITYDLVSLFRDAYVDWDEGLELDWCIRYWERARRAGLPVADTFDAFYCDYEWMGVQRQLKVLGIFARLAYRDGKTGYLDDQPRVASYLRRTCARYGALGGLLAVLDELEARPTRAGYTF